MNFKRKYILMGLVLLLIAWIGNIFYHQNHILKEPILIKQYCDVNQVKPSFYLYYIANINQENEIESISFPEIEPSYVHIERYAFNDNRFYKLNIIKVNINIDHKGNIPNGVKNKVLTKARLNLRNRKIVDVNIGRIYLFSEDTGSGKLKSSGLESRSQYTGSTTFSSPEDLKVYGVSTKFPEMMDGPLEIYINNAPLKDVKFPINVNKDGNIKVGYKLQFDKEDIRKYNAYDFSIYLLTEDKKGEKGVNPVFINYWLQSPEEYDITAMIRDRSDD